jgi:hypothetical protein
MASETSRLRLLLKASFAVVVFGCADEKTSGSVAGAGGAGGAGDAGCGALELRLGEFTEEGQPLSLLQDGDFLHLWNAPQGGHVVLVGAEVRGLSDDVVSIEARLVDEDSGELVKDDFRSIIMKPIEAEPGWMSPYIRSRSQVAHIPLCPDVQRRTLQGKEFLLNIEISELGTECELSKAEQVRVTPDCLQRDDAERAFCTCQCQPEYEPGSCAL